MKTGFEVTHHNTYHSICFDVSGYQRVLQKYNPEKNGLERKTLWGVSESAQSPFNYSYKARISQFKTSIITYKSAVKTDHEGKKKPLSVLEIGKSQRRLSGKNHLYSIIEWEKKPCCYTYGSFFSAA